MYSNYIIKNRDGKLLSFYYENKKICYKAYNLDRWEDKGSLIDDVREDFSLNLSDDGKLYIICQMIKGDVILLNEDNQLWNKRVILKRQRENINNTLFYALIHKEQMELVYLIDYGKRKSEIMSQKVINKKENNIYRHIDSALSLPEGCFKLQKIKDSHYVILYQKREGENQLGYKEINEDKQSNFIVFHKTGYRIIDSSFIAESEGIHFLYIVKSMFSSQVIYRRKDEKGLSNPVVLYEGQGISLCNIFFSEGELYASWVVNRQLFYTVSKNNGDVFERILRDKKYSNTDWIKASYLCFDRADKNKFLTNEIYLDLRKALEPVFILEFNDELYKAKVLEKNRIKQKEELKNLTSKDFNEDNTKIVIERMKNQLEIAQKQSNEKDKQLIQLNNVIQAKNREIIRIENMFNKKIKELKQENESLKNKLIAELKQENNLKITIKKGIDINEGE